MIKTRELLETWYMRFQMPQGVGRHKLAQLNERGKGLNALVICAWSVA